MEYYKRCFEAAKGKIDILRPHDDYGTQISLLFSIDMWKEFFEENTRKLVNLAHSYGAFYQQHSCGAIGPLIPYLIDCGVDALEPIQKVKGFEVEYLAKEYGGKIVFHGGIDTQRLLPFGKPEEVKEETKKFISLLGKDGYILMASQAFEGDVPTVEQGKDGRYYAIYKAVGDGPFPKGGSVICGVAISDSPLGPFVKEDKPIMINPENNWSVEDPYFWYQDDRFYALVKDFQGYFTKRGKNTVALFESKNGIDWEPAEIPFAFETKICWEDGKIQNLTALERPQLLIENGKPTVLYCAAAATENREDSFNVAIPLEIK